ncbi:MAG: MBL fold metallo-hydrolase [bacterium]|nr:MBL fold metallo-hydrolase [bacterium]
MQITFLGGAQEVTGSAHILATPRGRILRDCGLFQGHRKDARTKCESIGRLAQDIDAVLLSHAHIDHCGNLPTLVKHGFHGPIHATHATADLCTFMLRDAAHIQEKDAEYINARAERKKMEPVEPLYTLDDVEATLSLFHTHHYHQPLDLTPDIRVTAFDAGHVLGAALHLFEIRNNGSLLRLGYAFDLGRKNLPILRDPEQLTDLDALVIETTYGNRYHRDIAQTEDLLAGVINRVYARGGKIIIPSFALERAQEVLYTINTLYCKQRIPPIPVIIDSPLTAQISAVFARHRDLYDEETLALEQRGCGMLNYAHLTFISDVEDSKALNHDPRPMVIISASGMCESGRILHHLKNNVTDPRNAVVIVGYQAEGTLGRRIVDRATELKIFGMMYPMRAERVVLNTYSGHADRNDLLAYVDGVGTRCRTFILVHGEEKAIQEFAAAVRERRPDARVVTPARGDVITL